MPSHTTCRFDHSVPPLDPAVLLERLIDLVSRLPPLLPDSCEWLDQGAVEFVGGRPVDAGSVADVWVGMMGNRTIAIKSYRYYSSSDYLPTYVVSDTWLVVCTPTADDQSVEILQGGIGLQSSQRPERRAVHRNIFYSRSPVGSRL